MNRTHRLNRGALVALSVLAVLAAAPGARADGGNLLLKNGTVLTVTKGILPRGDVLILGGVIKQVGENIAAPEGVRVVDVSGKYILPGIIDSHTHIALAGTNEGTAPITPEVDMSEVVVADDVSMLTALAGGVTMIHTLHGSANAIGGQDVTLKLKWGKPSEELIVKEAYRTLKFALGENPKQSNRSGLMAATPPRYPATRMGVNAIIRRELETARVYMAQWDRYNKLKAQKNPPPTLVPPRRDLRMEALADLLRGKLVARCHSYVAPETIEFLNLAKEFGFKVACFEHAWEAYKIVDELLEAGAGISVFADSWAYKMEAAEGIAYNAGYCAKRGLLVSINSDSGERIRRLFNDAAKTMKYGGLSEDEALRLVTINPAIQLGVDKIVGSLEVGKHGDVAVFNEHPMSAYTRCDLTVIEGDVYFDRAQVLQERAEAAKKPAAPKTNGGAS